MDRDVILFNHTHTQDSNRFEAEVRGLDINSHATDYVEVVRRFPEGLDAVFVKTDHWKTDPAFFERIRSRLTDLGVTMERYETHVCFEIGGSVGAIINGVETSLLSERRHVTIGGLPVSDAEVYHDVSVDQLVEVGASAGWIAPAHVGIPFHGIPRTLLDDLFAEVASADVSAALGYTTGYFPLYNRLARNEIPFRDSVSDLADEYGVSLVPELDLHGVLPHGLSGCGVLDAAVVERLREGALPTSDILAADLLRPAGCRRGLTVRQVVRNYGPFVPFVPRRTDPARRFRGSIPDREWLRALDVSANTVPLQ